MSFTYAQLKTALQDYTENEETSFVNNLPVFIRQAEERILKNVQLTLFRKNVEGTIASGSLYLNLPEDFLAPFSFALTNSNEKIFLEFKDVNFLQSFNPNPATTGVPRYYALFDIENLILAPTASTSYESELHYYYRPASLTAGADSGTTWLSENAEVTLLYGSLIECYTYMKGENDLMQQYDKKFLEALTALKMFGEAKEVTDAYRTGLVTRQKT